MPRYFFDVRDDDNLVSDELGFEFPDIQSVRKEAERALGDFAKDLTFKEGRREFGVEVRDDHSRPVLRANFIAEMQIIGAA